MRHFFISLGRNIAECFSRKNLPYHGLLIVLTYLLVTLNLDWFYFIHTRYESLYRIFSPAVGIGALIPMFLPLLLIAIGVLTKKHGAHILGWTLLQATLLGLFLSSLYKAFTGRTHPPHDMMNLVDSSHGFRFGFMEGGIFWGWPSSHTTIAFATAFALINLYPKNLLIRYGALIYAFYIGIGVSLRIHWLSEFLAGALLGAVIGSVVGASFRKHFFI